MSNLFVVISAAGPARRRELGTREQPLWDEHAAFIDGLVTEGFIVLGGPLPDEGGALLVVRAASEEAARGRLAADPWYRGGILRLATARRWEIFIDQLSAAALPARA